jgi:hypothetical protein
MEIRRAEEGDHSARQPDEGRCQGDDEGPIAL